MRWELAYVAFLIGVLFTLAYANYMVNAVFYRYGLVFSWDWAFKWWTTFALLFGCISGLVSISYMFMREESKRNLFTAFVLGFSVWWQQISGNEDLVFFLFDAIRGTFWIHWDTVWTWSPFNYVFGINWTSRHQIAMTAVLNLVWVAVIVCWILYLKREVVTQKLRSLK